MGSLASYASVSTKIGPCFMIVGTVLLEGAPGVIGEIRIEASSPSCNVQRPSFREKTLDIESLERAKRMLASMRTSYRRGTLRPRDFASAERDGVGFPVAHQRSGV
ncbi:hypothetical protein FA13DRAFT_473426 [Coprinellus micaceus]|uniref:Uncharacterized protein n=1 Tax=Coprinellus micaceus TaxID=71717 RepID=A0A4Y7TAL8_COPMI|nr:hypothetical protein FA13DRAFT_473426 [Coprinellus micaceus]